MIRVSAIVFCCLVFAAAGLAQSKWVGTWSAAPYDVGSNNMPPAPGLANNSLRQIVRVSIGGDTVRVKFTNGVGNSALILNAVTLAVSPTGSDAIDPSTLKTLSFSGNASVSIGARSTVTSDPIAFALSPSARVAITIHYGAVPSPLTGHPGSRTPSYLLTGNRTTAANFSGAATVERWYTINTIDVRGPQSAGAVAIIGNSITDGYGLTGGLHNRWTDVLSESLLANPATQNVGVLNMGIGATNVATGTTGGLSRFRRDIFEQEGLRYFIIFYGVNDIGGGAPASRITDAYSEMISEARSRGVRVYGATITPFNGSSYYSTATEAVRSTVNAWIRTPGNFDAVIDFDRALRNPSDTTRMQANLRNDWLHPNVEGLRALGRAVDHALFVEVGGSSSSSVVLSSSSVVRGPYDGAIVLPGTLQVENYDLGGQGVAYSDSNPENQGNAYRTDGVDIGTTEDGGYAVAWTTAGEWLEYMVQVSNTAASVFSARVASTGESGRFRLLLNGVVLGASIAVPNTGGWNTYTEVGGVLEALPEGNHILRLEVEAGGFNIDWLRWESTTRRLGLPSEEVDLGASSPLFDLQGRKYRE